MRRTGIANLPLHQGKAPPWLFRRMAKLGGAIAETIAHEYGQEGFIRRISDPFFFQSFGCVVGFDWHSSGVTTTLCGALKEAINREDIGIYVAGGKGRTSKKAPEEIEKAAENFNLSTAKTESLVYSSRMSAKVDNSLVQDNYQLYHHCFFFTEKGRWAVVQQGMNNINSYARRYHWLSESMASFVHEPHNAICAERKEKDVLDMTAKGSREAQKVSVDIVKDGNFERYFKDIKQKTLLDFGNSRTVLLGMQRNHYIKDMHKTNIQTLQKAYEIQPKNYEGLVAIKGIGPKTVRALALIADIAYGTPASWKDPAKFSFAHGGKDGIPYPVNKRIMDSSTETLKDAVRRARLGEKEKLNALKRLANFI